MLNVPHQLWGRGAQAFPNPPGVGRLPSLPIPPSHAFPFRAKEFKGGGFQNQRGTIPELSVLEGGVALCGNARLRALLFSCNEEALL